MEHMHPRVIRTLTEEDADSLLTLEERIWPPLGVERISRDTLAAWLQAGLLIGCCRQGELLGYAYVERIDFSRIPPYSKELLAALDDYSKIRHRECGNALHGVSIVSTGKGTGRLLLEALLSYCRREGLRYFVSLARLSGLRSFVEGHREALQHFDLETVACLYAHQVVSLVDPLLIGPPLQLVTLPETFPRVSSSDSVVGRLSRVVGKELWAVARTSFTDPESLGYSALLVRALH